MARELQKTRKEIRPIANSTSADDHILLRLDMPGVDKKNLDIKVEGHELAIVGSRNTADPKGVYLRRERPQGDFRAVYTLDDTIDTGSIDAKLENGVLSLKLGYSEKVKPRRIDVKAG
jgi:HSP20 family protein